MPGVGQFLSPFRRFFVYTESVEVFTLS